jgi:serine/threonine-protein kinase
MQEHDPARTLVFHPSARSIVFFGTFRFDLADGLLVRGGDEIPLPPRAVVILRYLVERAGRVVSKQALMDAAWKDAYVTETSLTEAIGLVRQALGDDPQKPTYIQTVHRRGYRFIAPISTDVAATAAVGSDRGALAASAYETGERPLEAPPATARRHIPRAWLAAFAATLALLAIAIAWLSWRAPAPENVVRLSLTLPADQAPAPALTAHPAVTISPDGQRIVYAAGATGDSRLFVRRLDQFEAEPLSGTEGAHGPFFSPDGRWVAFFAGGQVKKVAIDGGQPQVLCATTSGVGGTWLSPDEIVFAPSWAGPLMRVSANGGTPRVIATPSKGYTYRWPDRIDDSTVLATRWRSNARDSAIVAISLSAGEEHVIAESAVFGRHAPGGFVAFIRDGDLYAVRVDATYRPRGPATRVLPDVLTGFTGAGQLAVAPNGTLLYVSDVEDRARRAFGLVDASGQSQDLPTAPRPFRYFATCGDRLAATVGEHGQSDLWVGHIDREALTRVTQEGYALEPTWSSDCRTLVFGWNRSGVSNFYSVRIDSGEPPKLIAESAMHQQVGSLSADGRWLSYTEQGPDMQQDVWLRDMSTGTARPLVQSPAQELIPRISPDGRWVAYESNASGDFELLIASVSRGSHVQVSAGGGLWPAWSADGRYLYYIQNEHILRLPVVEREGELVPGQPVTVFSHPDLLSFRLSNDRIVWLRRTAEHLPLTRFDLVLNWTTELERQVQ